MPYKVSDDNCVHKVNPDGSMGKKMACHPDQTAARKHQQALYAAEEKGLDMKELEALDTKELKTKMMEYGYSYHYVPWAARSFSDLDAAREAEEANRSLRMLTDDFSGLVNNIINDPETDTATAIKSLADEYADRVENLKNSEHEDEEKELSEKASWTAAYVNDLPDSSFLFVESGEKDAEGKTTPRSLRHLPYKDKEGNVNLAHVRNSIARAGQVKLKDGVTISHAKAKALQSRAQKILERAGKKEKSFLDKALEATGLREPTAPADNELMVWKDKETDTWRWLARYSNNLRDDDYPPEIIAATSHQRFVGLVENKEVTPPEAWLWHVPEWKFGEGEWVAWDEGQDGIGFALAAGHFYKEADWLAEKMAELDHIGVSHGMLKKSIRRSEEDPTVIIEHLTREISPLPPWAAANKWADFVALKELEGGIVRQEQEDMAIPTQKRNELIEQWKLDPAKLDELEARNTATASKAKAEEVEHKEADGKVPAAGDEKNAVAEQTPAQLVPPIPDPTPTPEPPVFNEAQVATLTAALKEVVAPVLARLEAVEALTKELQKTDEEKIVAKQTTIPAASLGSMIARSVIGNLDAQVDGRKELAKSKPAENKEIPAAANGGSFLAPVIASIISEHTHR